MNSKLYLAIVGVLAAVIVIVVMTSGDSNKHQPTTKMPPNHPPIPTDVPAKSSTETPSKENVSKELVHEIEGLKKLVKDNPNSASGIKSVLQLANLLFDSHKPEEAIQYYKTVLQREPKNIDARLDLSVCYYNLGRLDEAIAETKQILSLKPDHTGALYNMGALEATRGNTIEAAKWWNKVIALDANGVDAQRAKEALSKLSEKGK
jgi:cytochrome c-type biogenesis protein CcmH/NrfG